MAKNPKDVALATARKQLEKLNPDAFEVYLEAKSQLRIESKNQAVESFSRASDVGLSIRVIKDSRMGFSFTTSLERDAIERACQSAVTIAAQMPQDPFVALPKFTQHVYPHFDQVDSDGLKLKTEQKVALALELESLCRKADPRITAVRSAGISEALYEVHLLDGQGEHIHHETSLFTASISCKAEAGGDSQMGGDYAFSHALDGLDIRAVAAESARTATELLGAGAAPTMKCPAILRNSVVAELMEFLSGSFSAEAIDKGRSMLQGKFGERYFSECITLTDDGRLNGGMGTGPFDGEGTPSGEQTLIDGGLVQSALYDLYYAKKFGKQPTGNASRGIKAPPSIGTTNLILRPGKRALNAITSDIDRGILITDLMGLHTANDVTGDFSLGASGILIERGKLTRPVRGFAVAGNVLELFRRVEEVGSDTRSFGSAWAPSLLVTELSIGGS